MTGKLVCFLAVLISSLSALPTGGQVVQGQAALLPSSDTLQVQVNGKAILHWDAFNIGRGEAVHFIQLEGGRAILNRVPTGPVSEILGRLQANCPLYLINPNGIFIGPNASIETAGFFASTANLSDEAFLRGTELLFHELGEGRIVNLGTISSKEGDVVLIARGIDNQGQIDAPNGMAVLATRELMLLPESKQCVFIRAEEAALQQEGIDNSGAIHALSVELNTASPYEMAIRHTGAIEAISAVEDKGRIYLVAETGGAIVDGSLLAEAGEVRVLGETVRIEERAVIDASGNKGGTVLIGGDYKGSNSSIRNAENTYVAEGAQINADGRIGDAGTIVVWSDGDTECRAAISAAAFGDTGNGGFVEISGKETLTTTSVPNLRSRSGRAGTLLLDPGTITITSGAASGPNTYGSTYINTTLASGNLILDTSTEPGGGAQTLTVTNLVTGVNGISWSTANSLTLIAGQAVTISSGASIVATGAGDITITGGTVVPFAGTAVGITIGAATVETAGTLTLTGYSGTSGSGISLSSSTLEGAAVTLSGFSRDGNGRFGIRSQNSQITSGTGAIQITGDATVNNTAGVGVDVTGLELSGTTNQITSTSGNISLTGLGSTAPGNGVKEGILISSSTLTTISTAGSISLTGTGFAAQNGHGISIADSTQITSTGSSINLMGTANSGGSGILLLSLTCQAATSVTMNGITDGQNNQWGFRSRNSQITSGTGNIQITGNASTNNTAGVGVTITGLELGGTTNQITSTSGNISLTGLGSSAPGTGGLKPGILISSSTLTTISTAGSISLTGTGFADTNGHGISIADSTQITSTGSSVSLMGTSGPRGSGILLVSLTCQAATSVTMNGITKDGSNQLGFRSRNSQIISGTGNIQITGDATTNNTAGVGVDVTGLELSGATNQITSTSGNISLTGLGSTAPGDGVKDAILIASSTLTTISTAGTISLTGTGFAAQNGHGIYIQEPIQITSTGSSITMMGTSVGSSRGIVIDNASVSVASTNAQLTGVGGTASASSGIFIFGTSAVTGTTGSLALQGTGGPGNAGILMTGGSVSTTGGGLLSFTGTGGTGTASGISFTGGTVSTTNNGNITLTGNTNGTGAGSHGISNAINITAAGTGTITALGTGGNGYGILNSGASALLQTADGNIILTGNGGGSGANAEGIGVASAGRIISTGLGSISLTGVASATGGNNSRGIVVTGAVSAVTANSGTVTVNGTGGGTGTGRTGLTVSASGKINTTSGLITGTCLGSSTGTNTCNGILVTGAGSLITTATGAGINLTATGRGTTTSNQGISLAAGGAITTTSNAPITLMGTGSTSGTSSNEGIFITGASTTVSTATGAIQMTGAAGGITTNGITVDTSATVVTNTAGLVTLNSSLHRVVVQNNSSVRTLGVGGPGVNDISVVSNGLSVTGGASGSAVISTVNGNVGVTSANTVVVSGSTVASSFGQITVGNAANTVAIRSVGVTMTGGSGSGAFAEISTNGGVLSIDGTTVSAGAISLTGGSTTNADARIITKTTGATTASTLIQIGQTVGQVQPTNLTLAGGGGAGAATRSRAVIATDQGGNILSTITGDYTITGGSTSNAAGQGLAGFYTGAGFIGAAAGSGNITLTGAAYNLTGGSSTGTNHAEIAAAAGGGAISLTATGGASVFQGGSGAATNARVITNGIGNIAFSSAGNVTMTGGSGAASDTLIECAVQGAITFNALNLSITGGAAAGQSGILTQSGNIAMNCSQNCQLTALMAAAPAIIQTFGSDLTMVVGGSINLVGALITTPAPTGNLLLIAGVDISIDGTSTVSALGTMASSLTLVVDNNFSGNPLTGPGQFILDAGGILTTGAVGTTPLKIYTVDQMQNTVNNTINGVVFVPGMFNVNTPTEQWSTYYAGGTYEGAAFKFYYKVPVIPIPPTPVPPLPPSVQQTFFNLVAVNLVELDTLLPVFAVIYKSILGLRYHFRFCNRITDLPCDPTFSPYGSFIFEDDVYWIGAEF